MLHRREPNETSAVGPVLSGSGSVVFMHIPKTGGTTLNAILDRQYSPRRILTISDPSETIAQLTERTSGEEFLLVRGHVPFGVHRELGIQPHYITMLRQPVERVISIYRYIRRDTSHPLHATVCDGMTLSDFMDSDVAEREAVNGQTKQLAGREQEHGDESILKLAKRNLETFAAVGLTERFDESLILFRRRLRWKPPFYRSKNVAPEATRVARPVNEIQASVEERNRLDIELYNFARDLFDRRIEAEGPSFRTELAAFRGLNRLARLYKGFSG